MNFLGVSLRIRPGLPFAIPTGVSVGIALEISLVISPGPLSDPSIIFASSFAEIHAKILQILAQNFFSGIQEFHLDSWRFYLFIGNFSNYFSG